MATTEPKIVLKFVRKTFPIEIKFDRKISNLIRNFFTLVRSPPWVKYEDNFTLKFLINSPGNYATTPHWNLITLELGSGGYNS